MHPLSTFMRIEAYRMFEYDAETKIYSSLFLTPFKDALILADVGESLEMQACRLLR